MEYEIFSQFDDTPPPTQMFKPLKQSIYHLGNFEAKRIWKMTILHELYRLYREKKDPP